MVNKVVHNLIFLDKHISTFELIEANKKNIETRAGNPEYLKIKSGDAIKFSCRDKNVTRRVKEIIHYKSLKELFKEFKPEDINPNIHSYKELESRYNNFPGYKERIKEYGILVLELE